MIYGRACGKVTRAPVEEDRPSGAKVVTVALVVNVSGEFTAVNATAHGQLAQELLQLKVGDHCQLSGPILVRVRVDDSDNATAVFDLDVREVVLPRALRGGSGGQWLDKRTGEFDRRRK